MSGSVENTFKRANELVQVGQKLQAANLIFELINNKRQHKRMWTKIHEELMMLYVRLCVELRMNKEAREGLISYRNIAQNQAPGSLEAVISYMLDLSEEKVVKARAQCKTSTDVTRIVDDLEEGGSSPEAILMAGVASEKDRLRSEQAILVPWLKFCWENLRSVLETLRSNAQMEHTYHATAHRAFAFCKTYGRKAEFKRLCEMIKGHLKHNLMRGKDGKESDEPQKLTPESMELHLGTRFEQLKVATSLHLWREGYGTIEEIHEISALSTKKPSVQLMATYYQKLTQMFLVSGNFLFHAFAYRMYYDISRERNKALTADQIKSMASSVLLASLSVSLPSLATGSIQQNNSFSSQKDRTRDMARMLGFDQLNPDRETIMRLVKSSKVLEDCSQDAREIYNALELQSNFDPQTLVERCAPRLAVIRADPKLEPYAAPLERLLIIRLISQLGRVFQSFRLTEFHDMVDRLGGSMTRLAAEKLIMQAVKSHQIPLRHGSSDIKIDHATGTIRFSENALEEDRTRDALADLAKHLSGVAIELKRATPAPSVVASAQTLSGPQILSRINEDQNRLVERKAILAQKRKEMEDLAAFRNHLKDEKDKAARRAREESERARLARIEADNLAKELEKQTRLLQEAELADKMRQHGINDPFQDMSPEERERVIKEKQDKQIQQALEQDKKMQTRAKRLDAWIRATREAEKSALTREIERRKIADREDFLVEMTRARQAAEEQHKEGLQLKASFARIHSYRDSFEKELKPIWNANVRSAKERWVEERKDQRRAEKIERALARRDEDMRLRRAEEENAKRAEMEAKRIREAEEEMKRREEARAAAEAELAANPPPPSNEGRWRPRTNMEAVMDETYQGRKREGLRQDEPAAPGPKAEPASESKPGVWRPKSRA